MDRLRTRAQERDPGGVLVLLDRRRRIAVDLCAVSPRSGVHRRPGTRPRGLLPQSVFYHRQRAAVVGEKLSEAFPTHAVFRTMPGGGAPLPRGLTKKSRKQPHAQIDALPVVVS